MRFGNWAKNWVIVLIALIAGTALGMFFQQFGITAPLFKNFVDFTISIHEVNLLFLRFGVQFGLKINLGTILGALTGILASR